MKSNGVPSAPLSNADGSSSSSSDDGSAATASQNPLTNNGKPADAPDSNGGANRHSSSRWTPLHREVTMNNLDRVEALLQNGADPNEMDAQGRKAIYYATETTNLMSLLLRNGAEICPHMDWEAKDRVLDVAFRKFHVEDDQSVLLRVLHGCMDEINQRSIARRTVCSMMIWLVTKLLWNLSYIYMVWVDIMEYRNDAMYLRAALTYTYTFTALFMYFEIFEFCQSLGTDAARIYIRNAWKWINGMTIYLVLATATAFKRGDSLVDGENEYFGGDFEAFVIATIVFLFVSLLADLKTTFLPFSIFVGGVTQILYDLIPFSTVTFAILLGFAFLYFIQGPASYGKEESSFDDAFFFVFTGFAGGLDDADSYLDVTFGVILVIILFNVVIAIVSSSWQTAVNASFINLCRHRIELIRRMEVDKKSDTQCCGRSTEACSEYLMCFWSFHCMDNEFWIDRFDEDWHAWAKSVGRQGSGRQHGSGVGRKRDILFGTMISAMRILFLLIFGALGLATLGLLWPTRIRKLLFEIQRDKDTLGMRVEHVVEFVETIEKDIASLHRQMDEDRVAVETRIDKLEEEIGQFKAEMKGQMNDLSNKMDLALNLLTSVQSLSRSAHEPDLPLPAKLIDRNRAVSQSMKL